MRATHHLSELELNSTDLLRDTEIMNWRKEILQGITVLPKIGVPGRIVVYGEKAEPILTGSNEEDVLVAAAEYGQGRIIAIAHDGYASDFMKDDDSSEDSMTTFHRNLKRWLTRGTYENETNIISSRKSVSVEKLMSSKIVVFEGSFSSIPSCKMTEFVCNGGALLYCLTPWGWLQLNEGKILSDVSYVALLGDAGIYYTEEYIWAADDGFSVEENKAECAHLSRVLTEVGSDYHRAVEKANMLCRLKHLPKGEFLKLSCTVEKLWKMCRQDTIKTPNAKEPVTERLDRGVLGLWLLCSDVLQQPNIKAPGVGCFPGDFSADPPLRCNTLEFQSDQGDFHSTACYLPAGQILKVEVLSGNDGLDWELLIGCHTDDLENDELRRWPTVNKKVKLVDKALQLSTPFGGLIYLISPNKVNSSICVQLENVVDAPRFRLTEGEKGKETWNSSRHSPGLWADICGEFVTISLPAASVRELEFDALTSVMKTWDSVIRLYHDLRGTDVTKFQRMWIVTDEQPSVGYMHSGYPIVTHLDVADPSSKDFLLNGVALREFGNWGVFHEIGHNMQRDEWTFEGTGEVTVNIFTLCAMETICHLRPWIHKWLQNQLDETQEFFRDGADFEKWKSSPGIALFVYAQLAHEFGWDSYRKVFRRYEAMEESEKPVDDQAKMDTWFSLFSEVVGLNLSPLALFWAIPLSEETVALLQIAFPVGFLPEDEITSFAPDRVEDVLRKFPEVIRTSG